MLIFLLLLAWPAAGTVLDGIVLENLSGRPVARARVSLEAIQGGAAVSVGSILTDSGGRFSFRSLGAGAYLLSAGRGGYAIAKHGQKRWNGPGAPIVLGAAGQFFAELRLPRLGAIGGLVLDENHLGLANHPVYAYRAGEQPLRMVASGVSDDRGVFRIAGLEPGRYYARTGPRQLEGGRSLLPTFFGQSTALAEAKQVEVELDREAGGIDIEPLPGRLGRLVGRVLGGVPATVELYSDTGKREAQVPADGSFDFDQLGPGDYHILALAGAAQPRAAWRRLRLGEGTTETSLPLGRLPTVRVRSEEKSGRPIDPRRVTVFLRRTQPPVENSVLVQGGETAALPPGEYQAAAVAPPEFYIDSFRMPRSSRRPNEFEAAPFDALELTVILSADPAILRGRVLAADGKPVPGAPVFLNAIDPELRGRLAGGRSLRADQNGEYRFYGLPPGRYALFSSFEIPQPQEAEWGTLAVSTIELEPNRQVTLDLKLIGGM